MSLTEETTSDDEDFKKISEANFKRIEQKSSKIGYADGVAGGHESSFQNAFDKGYAEGFRTGFEFEKFNTFYKSLAYLKKPNDDLTKEKSIYDGMSVAPTEDESHFQLNGPNDDLNIEEAAKQQESYVNNFLCKCDQTLPLTTNLLTSQNKQ